MKLDHKWFKMKVTLILCIFSSSDVGSKWRLLYSLLHPTTKHLNRLIRDILSSPAQEADSSQFTRGGSKVRQSCQSTIVGGVCTELHHSDRNLRTALFEKEDFKIGIFKIDFYHYRMDVYTSDGSFLNDSFILNKSLMWLGKNESSQWVIRSVAHAQHPRGSALN